MIDIRGLHKSFGRFKVLKNLNLRMETGMITAIVGPNASGKSTLIKCLLGLVKPDRGEIVIDGNLLDSDWTYRERIGYMPQEAHFPENLTGQQVVDMLTDLRGKPDRIDTYLLDKLNFEQELRKPLRTLSGGTRQKVSATIAFLFTPDIVILDEPTVGLDPVSSSTLKDKIRAERDHGKTVVLTSHIMSEVEELADYLVFLLDGKVHFEGRIEDIILSSGQTRLERAIARLLSEESIV